MFFFQQVFNPSLSLSEWNLAEVEASLSPVRAVRLRRGDDNVCEQQSLCRRILSYFTAREETAVKHSNHLSPEGRLREGLGGAG